MSAAVQLPPHLAIMGSDGSTLTVVATCYCGRTKPVRIEHAALVEWVHGKLVQDAFPRLDDDEREALVSGTCQTCWDAMGEPD